MSNKRSLMLKAKPNRVTGAVGNDTKGQHSLDEKHQYDASYTDYDEARDKREAEEAREGEYADKRDERRVAYEEELASDKAAVFEEHRKKTADVKQNPRQGRNRINDATFEKKRRDIIRKARHLANESKSQADDEAVEEFASEVVAGDDVGKYKEKQGFKNVESALEDTFHRMVPNLPLKDDSDEPDYLPNI